MRSSKRKALLTVCLATLFLAVLIFLDVLLYPCTFVRNDMHALATEENDVVILGTSNAKMGIDPDVLLAGTGLTGHNAANGNQYALDSYYIIKLLVERQKPKTIILDIDPGYYTSTKEEGNNDLLYYHEFPLSLAKISYFREVLLNSGFRGWLYPEYEYPISYEISHAGQTLKKKMTGDYSVDAFRTKNQQYRENGFIERFPVAVEDFPKWHHDAFKIEDIKENNMNDLDKLIQLCKKENIQLISVYMPLADASISDYPDEYQSGFDYFQTYFKDQNIPFYNFNTDYYDSCSHETSAFCDFDGHMNVEAAETFSKEFGDILKADGYLG